MDELVQMLNAAEKSHVRAIVFKGSGDTYFIGGADGIEMMQCNPEQSKVFSKRIQALFNRMEASPLILVAAINGLCFGGGFEFAMACDLRIAVESARIGLPGGEGGPYSRRRRNPASAQLVGTGQPWR